MRRLTLKRQASAWVELQGQLPKPFIEMIRSGIKPQSYRVFDGTKKRWQVHRDRLVLLISFARKYFDHVDYSDLPIDWQLHIAGARVDFGVDELIPDAIDEVPFTELFVTSDAPLEVIKASYRVLASIYHPDHGGSNEKMAKLNAAYEKVCKLRS